jgi:hypothetical protein
VKLRGRAQAPDRSLGRTVTTRARGGTTDLHGPLQRLLGADELLASSWRCLPYHPNRVFPHCASLR